MEGRVPERRFAGGSTPWRFFGFARFTADTMPTPSTGELWEFRALSSIGLIAGLAAYIAFASVS